MQKFKEHDNISPLYNSNDFIHQGCHIEKASKRKVFMGTPLTASPLTFITKNASLKSTSTKAPESPVRAANPFQKLQPSEITAYSQVLCIEDIKGNNAIAQQLVHIETSKIVYSHFLLAGQTFEHQQKPNLDDVKCLARDQLLQTQAAIENALGSGLNSSARTHKIQGVQNAYQLHHQRLDQRLGTQNGGKFDKVGTPLPHSLLRLNTGMIVHLANSLTPLEIQHITDELYEDIEQHTKPHPRKKGQMKCTLGEGGEGKVRYGVSLDGTKDFAIKKSYDSVNATREAQTSRALFERSARVAQFHGMAQLPNSLGKNKGDQTKTYLVFDFIQGHDGRAQQIKLHHQQSALSLVETAYEYARAAASVQEAGFFHSDIKLDCFLHDKTTGEVRIIDFGMSHSQPQHFEGGSAFYFPPESNDPDRYHAGAHDAFSLGVCFALLNHGPIPPRPLNPSHKEEPQYFSLHINGNKFPVRYFNGPYRSLVSAVPDTKTKAPVLNSLAAITLRLLEQDPTKRLSVVEAHKALAKLQG